MEDQVAHKIQTVLEPTHWRVRRLDRISGGNANFTYRGVLASDASKTIFIKHGENFAALNPAFQLDIARSEYEWFMLTALSTQPAAISDGFQVRTPATLDILDGTKILEDLPNSTTLKAYLSEHATHLAPAVAIEMGRGLGRWLSSFHNWIDADTDDARRVRDRIHHNPMVPLREGLYIGSYPTSMRKFPTEIAWPDSDLFARIDQAVRNMYRTPDGGIHGDFWTGNIIIPDVAPETLTTVPPISMFVVDFEVSQLGTRAQDLAQCLAELWMVHHFHGGPTPLQVMHGLVDGYGAALDRTKALQIAMHLGVHLVVIPWRYNTGWKQGEPLLECMRFGNDCLIHGFEEDVEWFRSTSLAFLFE